MDLNLFGHFANEKEAERDQGDSYDTLPLDTLTEGPARPSIIRRRTHDFVPTRANSQPAFGTYYLRAHTGGIRHGTGLLVLTLTGDRICAMARFDNTVLPWFGLPRSLPG